ncbi:MAG: TIGR02450 family Trp-rich protein [Pseudomonas sp.]
MRKLNPEKLLHSKWTACAPVNREKHFMVVDCMRDETTQEVINVELQAVLTRRSRCLPWQQLRDAELWHQGWH